MNVGFIYYSYERDLVEQSFFIVEISIPYLLFVIQMTITLCYKLKLKSFL